MTLFRVEVLRFTRTRRIVALLAVFLLAGFGGPVLARYLPDLVNSQTSENVTVIVSEARPVDGVSMFASNAGQLGLLVAVVIAAGALAVDAKPGLSTFYRTRVRPFDRVILPRFGVTAGAVAGSYVLGAVAAWYETTVLIGHVPAGRYAFGVALTVLYLGFAVAVVTLAASLTRSVVGTSGTAIAVLLALPVLGAVPALEPWLPSTLAGALTEMAGAGGAADFVRAAATTAGATAVVLLVALRRFRTREVV
ncbi:MAG TPA: hypothetical protein VFJ85_19215 [Acidimicrobiales bacterium]|nr:hypothetical protein [Acidimicrobiales bacterium]